MIDPDDSDIQKWLMCLLVGFRVGFQVRGFRRGFIPLVEMGDHTGAAGIGFVGAFWGSDSLVGSPP